VLGDVRHDGPLEPYCRVVPAEAAAARVLARIEPVARQVGQVDPADERDLVVDDDELLVMAVERPLLRVERHRDARAIYELVPCPTNLPAGGVE
jgi:hypothetical protein